MRTAAACLVVALALMQAVAEARDLKTKYHHKTGKADADSYSGAVGYGAHTGAGTKTNAGQHAAGSKSGAYAANAWVKAAADGVSKAHGYDAKTKTKTATTAYYDVAKSGSWADASNKHYWGGVTNGHADANSQAKGDWSRAKTWTKTETNKHGAWSDALSGASNKGSDAKAAAKSDAYGPGAKAKTYTNTKVDEYSASSKSHGSAKGGW